MSIEEFQRDGHAPVVPGLFRDRSQDEPAPDGIFLTHAHIDHVGLLPLTREDIPVYATVGTSKMMLAGKLFANQIELPEQRFRDIQPGKEVTIGDLKVIPLAVDHSAFGSVAYLIEGCGQRVLYSGDLRLHGRKPGMAHDLYQAVRTRGPVDLILMEGTNAEWSNPEPTSTLRSNIDETIAATDEYDLENRLAQRVSEAPGLVLASFSPQNVDRLVAMIRVAIKTGRLFVVDAYGAFILRLLSSETKLPVPSPESPVRLCPDLSRGRSIERTLIRRYQDATVDVATIRSEPGRYIQLFRSSMLPIMEQLPQETLLIHSQWSGYTQQTSFVKVRAALKATGGTVCQAHVSGHIRREQIAEMVERINPRTVVPIHTHGPEDVKSLIRTLPATLEAIPKFQVVKDGIPFELHESDAGETEVHFC